MGGNKQSSICIGAVVGLTGGSVGVKLASGSAVRAAATRAAETGV